MTDQQPSDIKSRVEATLKRRYAAETRFQLYGRLAILSSLLVLAVLLVFVFIVGKPAFRQTVIELPVDLRAETLFGDTEVTPEAIAGANYQKAIQDGLYAIFPDVSGRRDKRALRQLVSDGAEYDLRDAAIHHPKLIGTEHSMKILASSDVDLWTKAGGEQKNNRLNDQQVAWLTHLKEEGLLTTHFNWSFFTRGDSREPELAGILGAMVGSFYTLLVCIGIAFPLGVMAAIYLEELAPKNKWTRAIEVNINNLAAVPSIIFGILGLAVFLNFMGLPRSAPLVGGMVLALMTLPTIVIAGRASLQAVPPSIREAAMGLGASDIQTIFHHVLPLALPGIMTGSIIGMARALGETAPLLMIGMVAFIADTPHGVTDPAAALPVQVYLWADNPERGFIERTGAAIMVLLTFLLMMNAVAIYLRNKFETKW